MTMQITVEVPNRLGQQLLQFQDRLPEVLERGIRELQHEKTEGFEDEQAIIAILTSQPTPKQVLAIRPSPEFQKRVSELLAQNKVGSLSHEEEIELERYLVLEHLVRLAKIYAYQQLNKPS
jgi:hypothetical protein